MEKSGYLPDGVKTQENLESLQRQFIAVKNYEEYEGPTDFPGCTCKKMDWLFGQNQKIYGICIELSLEQNPNRC